VRTVVIVSADGEWEAIKSLMPAGAVQREGTWDAMAAQLQPWAVEFVHGGWGKVSAAASTQYVIDHMRPDLVINLGTCGGLKGRIDRGTVVLVERTLIYDIVEQMTDGEAALTHYATWLDLGWLPDTLPMPVQRGLMVSADRDILPAEAEVLAHRHQAVAADWESGAIAWVADRNHQPLLILRGVTDLVSSEGGEAYGNYELFLTRTREVMAGLLASLPRWLEAIEPGLSNATRGFQAAQQTRTRPNG
jgi:adenosylhomocysteine nucleosidase